MVFEFAELPPVPPGESSGCGASISPTRALPHESLPAEKSCRTGRALRAVSHGVRHRPGQSVGSCCGAPTTVVQPTYRAVTEIPRSPDLRCEPVRRSGTFAGLGWPCRSLRAGGGLASFLASASGRSSRGGVCQAAGAGKAREGADGALQQARWYGPQRGRSVER